MSPSAAGPSEAGTATRITLGVFAFLAVVWLAVYAWARLPEVPPLTASERSRAMEMLRAALDGSPAAPAGASDALNRSLDHPVLVTLYDRGAPVERVQARGRTLGDALAEAARRLRRQPNTAAAAEVRARGRLKLDVILQTAPILTTIEPLFALSLVPGVDGLGLDFGDRQVLLTADDLMMDDLLSSRRPLAALDFELGLDTGRALSRLAKEAGATAGSWRATRKRFYRFRADSSIEPAERSRGQAPAPVWRGEVPGPPVSADNLRRAARAGGDYLLRHLDDRGRFGYEYHTLRDQELDAGAQYSLPRHAGAAYFLAQLHGALKQPAFLEGARRAVDYLRARVPTGCNRAGLSCVGDEERPEDWVDLGATAMTLVAIAELERVSGDRALEAWGRRLAEFLLFMQKPDGDFCHRYHPATNERDEHTQMLYFSGEAAFALAIFDRVAPEPRYRVALDHALTFLAKTQYAHLAGQFFFLEDHWTCLAAEAGWDHLPPGQRASAAGFCAEFAAFLRRTQFRPGEAIVGAQPDFAGAYGFTPLLPPHPTPVGSRSEASIAAYQLTRRRGAPDAAVLEQVRLGMRFLLQHQIADDGAYLMPNPAAARGGFLMNDVKRFIRIDFVQHAGSAMLRASELL